jgi:excinuclease UvrABC nuclease subunit
LPDLILIDGGRGQLDAARAELAKLEPRAAVPILGLAKENEECLPRRRRTLRCGLGSRTARP